MCGDLAHEVLDDVADSVTGGPDEQPVRNLFEFFGSVGFGDFGFDVFVGYVLDHCFCADGDFFFLEAGFGVFDELFGEHGQDLPSQHILSVKEGEREGTLGNASTRVTWKLSWIPGIHLRKSSSKKSCNSPANSTPVGPPPTTTMCKRRLTSSSVWSLKQAVSTQSMIVLRIFWASPTSFKKQECSRTPGIPSKY